ncbi:esterase PHB depolymerase [Janthinobacterium sp. HH103]|uniref:extracellular catalytic domain type 1 short-chain-length polyhydroxyalkanoate depolymerase n=1 Tax=unclassified Janthinobacterium TaxID=2610881 RepID=UPI000873E5D1|nr:MULTISPECIES: alpha/beta hydrolase-fold protein [unclassified Janthinobacterium]OEZ70957.1 esterase PHB depolymerase [Janthinobacterium sp. HH100]OEZ82360.1 esterase PHB depolymerase [Janthinobacterium sp. HH103]QOU74448.1 Putative esterase [Janthinobacterium sp. HH102]
MKFLISLLVLACTSLPALAQVSSLVHKEEKRRYIVYTPEAYQSQPQQNFPVVFNFHGGGMSMAEQMLYTQMNKAAERHRFIVVYPQGIKQDWNVGFGMDYLAGTDDVGFTQAILSKLKQDYRIDDKRVYATGLSRGGFFALRLAAELPQQFAAVASVGAPMPEPVLQHHKQKDKVGMLLMQGTADKVVLIEGKAASYLSAEDTYDYWRRHNGIEGATPQPRLIPGPAGDATQVSWQEQGAGGAKVALLTIKDGGHTWPGADAFNIGLPIGKTTHAIDANEVMWEFFSKHRR